MITDGQQAVLQGYIDGVLDGELVVSQAVRHAVERHVRDLSRQSTEEFPYHFDHALAAKVCRFFPVMTKHSIGRFAGFPFELSPWQVFCTSMLFGWLRDADSTRRFRRDYRSMGRKNGKSTWIAAESLYQAGFDRNPITGKVESVAQVVLAATKKEQVQRVIFAEAQRMLDRSPLIARMAESRQSEIRFPANDGSIIVVGSDRPFSGLNPHAVKLDEVHEYREFHRKFYDTMLTGSAARDQPLISIITTAGDDTSHLWQEIYKYAKSVVQGMVEDETYFSFICEIDEDDDPLDESVWIKANPNIGVSVPLEVLQAASVAGKTSRIDAARLIQYHCNRQITSTEQAFDLDQWDACKGVLSDWAGADAVGSGVDLGARDDLAAEAQVARFVLDDSGDSPIYRYEIRAQAYIGEDTQRDVTKPPFSEWIYRDLIKKSRYPIADLRENLIEKCSVFGCSEVAYDPYNGQVISEDLSREGIQAFRMAQSHSMFNEPIRDFMAAMREGRLIHDGNPLLRWCVGNAILYRDRKDLWMFDKKTSGEKIDPIVAVVMAFRVACRAPRRYQGMAFIN